MSEEVLEEIEALTAILDEDTVEILSQDEKPAEISIKITPLTASEQEKQYVSLTLVVSLTEGYPGVPPGLDVRNPRGLEDTAVKGLLSDMKTRCEEYSGCPVMFELIEMAREFLTARNVPVVRCIICLNNIQEEDVFMKTECLHFFHKHCLGRYITSMQEIYNDKVVEAQKSNATIDDFEVTCPVCRENIGEYNLSDLLKSPPPISEKAEPLKYTISEDVKKMQRAMQELFLQQKEKGGIIDLEAEQKKYLVVTNSATSQEESLAELSPTDYQPDGHSITSGGGSSPKKSPVSEEEDFQSYKYYQNSHRGKGRGGKRGFHHKHGNSHSNESTTPTTEVVEEDVQDERDRRNAYRKNHYMNRGKSHHQLKKGKDGKGLKPGNEGAAL